MISIVAAVPHTAQLQDLLQRQLARFGEASIHLIEDGSVARVNAALHACTTDRILLIDEHSLPLGDWHRANFPQRFGMLGGIIRTYAGTRAGYSFNRNAVPTATIRKHAVPLIGERSGTQYVDLPNEGCVLMRRLTLEKTGPLDESLPLPLALIELTLRARELYIEAGFDVNLNIDRDANFIEPTLDDEVSFAQLRSAPQWDQLLRGPAHRAELRTVHLVAHGVDDERRLAKWSALAGYPIAHATLAATGNPREMIADELRYRARNVALIDLRAEPVQDWLLSLIEAGTGNTSIGIVTCGVHTGNHRLVAADASATLVMCDRIPAQIILRSGMKTFDGVLEDLSIQAASLGVVTHASRKQITRVNGFSERNLDAYSLEVLLKSRIRKPSVSFVLLAGSVAGVHRYTTDAMRSHSGDLAELFVAVRSDAPKITARLRNHLNVELVVDPDDELAGNALSRSLAAASGDVIVIMRDDYLVAEHWLSSMLAHLDRLPDVGIVVPRLSAVPGDQNCEEEMFADSVEFRLAAERRRQARAREAKLIDVVQMPSFVMRRAVLEKIGGFDDVMATSHCGMIDYCIRARTAGFGIALAEDVFVHHIPFEHTQLPFDALMSDAVYEREFTKKWALKPGVAPAQAAPALIGTPLARHHRFVALAEEREIVDRLPVRDDEERVVFLLPLLHENAWQQAGNLVRKYLNTFTAHDRVTLAIGRNKEVRTSVVMQRIRKMIVEQAIDESLVPDIMIADAYERTAWLDSLPPGPRHLILSDDALQDEHLLADCSPSGLRRAVDEFAPCANAGESRS